MVDGVRETNVSSLVAGDHV